MRYAALVSYAESSVFGPHQMLAAEQRKIVRAGFPMRHSTPLRSTSNPFSRRRIRTLSMRVARAGEKIFEREGCAGCHTPGLYTNNKLTLAKGFTPPAGTPSTLDVMAVSVGTDPDLALKTRKGTGYYKVPSLQRRVVSRSLPARRFDSQFGGDVRSRPAGGNT